jgi:4-hydroxy-tetrahydrodipicolinate synthase
MAERQKRLFYAGGHVFMIEGVFTALITPFTPEGAIDETGFILNLKRQIAARVSGVVVLGTTGETPTLTAQERRRLIELAVETCGGEIEVWVGTGTASTEETITRTLEAKALGAQGAMICTPYYNKPTQEGLFCHFKAIAERCAFPLMIYNIPGRTAVNLEPKTLIRLLEFKEIVAVKEASGNLGQIMDLLHSAPTSFSILSGDDAFTLPVLALGGVGIVSVISNLVPEDMVALTEKGLAGDFEGARALHNRLLPLIHLAFIETNPAPIKAMMAYQGLAAGGVRLPLVPLSPSNQLKIETCLKEILQLQP